MKAKHDLLTLMGRVLFLRKVPLFENVKSEELKAIAAICQEKGFVKDELIVKENDIGDSLFIVKQGSVRITKIVQHSEIVLTTLHPKSYFGEMGIFDNAPRSANCYADESCVLLTIFKDTFRDVVIQYPEIALQLFVVFSNRLRESNERIKELSELLEKKGVKSVSNN